MPNIYGNTRSCLNTIGIALLLVSLFTLSSCSKDANSPEGFSLPEGDPKVGQQSFVKHKCGSCHTLEGMQEEELEHTVGLTSSESSATASTAAPPINRPPIKLGANSALTKTYAQLVTSIINPSHRLSKGQVWDNADESGASVMYNYNDVLTVSELIDLVAYLQGYYKVTPYPYTIYPDLSFAKKDKQTNKAETKKPETPGY